MQMWSKIGAALTCVALSSCGAATGLEVGDGGSPPGSFDGGQSDGGQLDGGQLDGGRLDGGRFDGGRRDGGLFDGGSLDGGPLDGGPWDGGLFDGGRPDGGLDGGPPDGGPLDAGPLGEVRARFPWNGYSTGSVHDPNALRPTVRWHAVPGAAYYRVELTSECAIDGFLACAFASPERSETTTATRYRPATALPVSTSAPVGRRYFWRVQSCDAADVCTAWSPVRYVDVGRMPQDFNGDGYADLAIGALRESSGGTRGGRVHVHEGSPAGLGASAAIVLAGTQAEGNFGGSVAALGDVNGDGYADLAIGAGSETFGGVSRAGAVYVHYGGPGGISAAPNLVVGGTREDGAFGVSVAGAGDLDGDGYADLAIGTSGIVSGPFDPPVQGWVHVHRGGSGGLSASAAFVLADAPPEGWFGRNVAGVGDVDGDGYVELAVAASGHRGIGPGRVYVYRGGASGLSMPARLEADVPGERFGWGLSGGDVDGDGYADLVIGHAEGGTPRLGRVQVYGGGPGGLGTAAALTIEGGDGGRYFGGSVGTADVDGDGYDDLVVGDWRDAGEVQTHRGGPGGLAVSADVRLAGEQSGGALGYVVAGIGDVDGDGYEDVAIGAHLEDVGPTTTPGGEGRVHVYHGSAAGLDRSSHMLFEGQHENGFFGVSLGSASP